MDREYLNLPRVPSLKRLDVDQVDSEKPTQTIDTGKPKQDQTNWSELLLKCQQDAQRYSEELKRLKEGASTKTNSTPVLQPTLNDTKPIPTVPSATLPSDGVKSPELQWLETADSRRPSKVKEPATPKSTTNPRVLHGQDDVHVKIKPTSLSRVEPIMHSAKQKQVHEKKAAKLAMEAAEHETEIQMRFSRQQLELVSLHEQNNILRSENQRLLKENQSYRHSRRKVDQKEDELQATIRMLEEQNKALRHENGQLVKENKELSKELKHTKHDERVDDREEADTGTAQVIAELRAQNQTLRLENQRLAKERLIKSPLPEVTPRTIEPLATRVEEVLTKAQSSPEPPVLVVKRVVEKDQPPPVVVDTETDQVYRPDSFETLEKVIQEHIEIASSLKSENEQLHERLGEMEDKLKLRDEAWISKYKDLQDKYQRQQDRLNETHTWLKEYAKEFSEIRTLSSMKSEEDKKSMRHPFPVGKYFKHLFSLYSSTEHALEHAKTKLESLSMQLSKSDSDKVDVQVELENKKKTVAELSKENEKLQTYIKTIEKAVGELQQERHQIDSKNRTLESKLKRIGTAYSVMMQDC